MRRQHKTQDLIIKQLAWREGVILIDTNTHYNNVLFSAIYEEFYYSVWSVYLSMKHRCCHTPPSHITALYNTKQFNNMRTLCILVGENCVKSGVNRSVCRRLEHLPLSHICTIKKWPLDFWMLHFLHTVYAIGFR